MIDLSLVRHRAIMVSRIVADVLSQDCDNPALCGDALAMLKQRWELIETREPARVSIQRQVELLAESVNSVLEWFHSRVA